MYALLQRFVCANKNHLRCYSSFTPRDVLRETADETGTLLTRFAKHIAVERYNSAEHVLQPTKIRYVDYFPISDERYFQNSVQKTPASQLPPLIIHASSYRSNAPPPMYAMALNTLDAQAVAELPNMDTTTVLETLYAFLFLIPNWMKRTDFYHAAVRRLAKESLLNETTVISSKERFVQLIFYLGLQKKQFNNNTQTASHLETLLCTQLPKYLPDLSLLDLALVSNAAYKTSTVVSGHVRKQYEAVLVDAVLNTPLVPGNDAILVCCIKALRLQQVRDEGVCQHLMDVCLDSEKIMQLEPRGLAHIFAYFAEQAWDHEECMAAIVDRLMTSLKPGSMRPKDLATFVWCCAQLDCALSASQLNKLEVAALRKLDMGEYDYYPDNLVDTCLSLCILGHYSRQLIDAAEELKAKQRSKFAQPKVDSRLTVLRSAVAIEQPEWTNMKTSNAFKEMTRAPNYLLKERADLIDYANEIVSAPEIESVDMVCPINGINVPNLRVSTAGDDAQVFFVELLTSQQVLKISRKPSAMVRLKRRLLEALGQKVVVLNSTDMATNKAALQQILQQSPKTTSSQIEDELTARGLNN